MEYMIYNKYFLYQFENLQYELIRPTFKSGLIKFASIFFSGLFFAVTVIGIGYNFFRSPKELMQQREIEQYELQFSILQNRLDRLDKVAGDLQERDDNIYRIIFEAEPIPAEIRKAGIGGANRYSKLMGFKNSELILNTSKKAEELSNQLYVQSKSFDEVFELARMAVSPSEQGKGIGNILIQTCLTKLKNIKISDGKLKLNITFH